MKMVKRAKTDRDAHFRDGSSVHAQALSNHSQHWYEALSRSPGAHFDWPRPFAQVSETVAEMQTWLQIMAQMSSKETTWPIKQLHSSVLQGAPACFHAITGLVRFEI
jgi:hypothetical protein